MKIAVFSDIHANLQALEAILNDIKQNNFDEIYFLGDALSKGPNPKECLELIMNNNINMTLGNHELYFLRGVEIDNMISENEKEHQHWVKSQLNEKHREYLERCPLEIIKEYNGLKVAFKHFLMKDKESDYPFYLIEVLSTNKSTDIIKNLEEDLSIIGHEHRIFELRHENKIVYDIGSSGCLNDDKTYYTIISINNNGFNIEKKELSYDRKSFEETIRNIEYPERELISKIFFGL